MCVCGCGCVCVCLSVCLSVGGEKLKNKVIQSEEFNVKASRRYNVSVSINR